MLELAGPRVRIPERIWALEPPVPKTLGMVGMLNPAQEGGVFNFVGRAWKYRKCIEERRAAKRVPGRVHDGSAVTQPHRRCQAQIRRLAPVRLTFPLMR